MNFKKLIKDFVNTIAEDKIEIYNEFSVQIELIIFLRSKLKNNYKIQAEHNIDYFGLNKKDFHKKEMDIVVFDNSLNNKFCIEIKYPTNGQYPEQIFKFSQDVAFIEQLVKFGFSKSYSLVLTEDKNFYSNRGGASIYEMFRKNRKIEGIIRKPTGKKDKEFKIVGSYDIQWEPIIGDLKYYLIEVTPKDLL